MSGTTLTDITFVKHCFTFSVSVCSVKTKPSLELSAPSDHKILNWTEDRQHTGGHSTRHKDNGSLKDTMSQSTVGSTA